MWVLLGGRGAGKTRAGAEWIRGLVESGRSGRIALVGPSLHDVREVMIEGPSGLRALAGERPVYEVSRRRLLWPNGAEGHALSAEDPDSFRGPNFDSGWADEFCAWPRPEEALSALRLGLRAGTDPRLVVTTTPRPIPALKSLLAEPGVHVTRSATLDNRAYLAAGFVEAVQARWGGTIYGRQELDGELIEDPQGALWRRAEIEACRTSAVPKLDRIVVAIDPPASGGPRADACGIIAAGAYGVGPARRGVVLADASAKGLSPQGWAARAASLAEAVGADRIVAEANMGGDMVQTVLRLAAPDFAVRLVRATKGKRARAEPIAALYEQGRVAHAASFPALEDEMCAFGAPGFSGSPDRLDALVWALTDLMLGEREPRLRVL